MKVEDKIGKKIKRIKLVWKINHEMGASTHFIIELDPMAEEEEDIEISFVAVVQVSKRKSSKEKKRR